MYIYPNCFFRLMRVWIINLRVLPRLHMPLLSKYQRTVLLFDDGDAALFEFSEENGTHQQRFQL